MKIKKNIIYILSLLETIGIKPLKLTSFFIHLPQYIKDVYVLYKQNYSSFGSLLLYPILDDKYKKGGTTKDQYFNQDLLIASKIYKNNPIRHIDIGSRVDGFIAHLAVFRTVEIVDIRKIETSFENIKYIQADLTQDCSWLVNATSSLSCLHALEHFGLGRYGDEININGHVEGFKNMTTILNSGGTLYISLPIGPQRIEFNAHRIFSISYLLELFKPLYEIVDFHYVNDEGVLIHSTLDDQSAINSSFECSFGLGIFELRKK